MLFTGREAGDARDAATRARIGAEIGRPLAHGRQVHGTRVVHASEEVVEADGQATRHQRLAPAVLVADCLPVAIAGGSAVAMVHAGWRGLAGGILEEGVRTVRALGDDGPLSAAIGPGAGPCCYEIGDEVRRAFGIQTKVADLKGIATRRLNAIGVDHVEDAGICTICDSRYFSFRREGEAAGRQLGIVWRT